MLPRQRWQDWVWNMTLTLFFVFPTFVNSFVLPNQQMQLEVKPNYVW